MHALKEMWKPIFADQEIEVMKMIPAKNFQQTLWCHPFPVVEFVVKEVHKRKEASMSSFCELCQHSFLQHLNCTGDILHPHYASQTKQSHQQCCHRRISINKEAKSS